MAAAKQKKNFTDQFDLLPLLEVPQESPGAEQEQTLRISSPMKLSVVESMKDYCYWNGLTQQQLIETAVLQFLEKAQTMPRPEAIKARPKTGRKQKMTHNR